MKLRWIQYIQGVPRYPVLVGDTVMIVAYNRTVHQYEAMAYCSHNGELRWKVTLPAGGYGRPVTDGSRLYLLWGQSGLAALNVENGDLQWAWKTPWRIRSGPALFKDMVYLCAGNCLIAATKQEGRETRRFQVGQTFLFGNPCVSLFDSRPLLFVLGTEPSNNYLYCVSLDDTGVPVSLEWKRPIGKTGVVTSETAGPAVSAGRVVVGSLDGTVTCFACATGQVLWTDHVGEVTIRSAAFTDGERVYITTLGGSILAYDLHTGVRLWGRQVYAEGIWAPPALAARHLIVLGGGVLEALDPANGSSVAQVAVGHGPYSAPVPAGTQVFVGGGDPPFTGYLFAVDLAVTDSTIVADPDLAGLEIQPSDWEIQISFQVPPLVTDLWLDGRSLGADAVIRPSRQADRAYFRFALAPGKRIGKYALPVALRHQDGLIWHTIFVDLGMNRGPAVGLPQQAQVSHLTLEHQAEPAASGAAALTMLLGHFGLKVSQQHVKEMADRLVEMWQVDPHHKWAGVAIRIAHAGTRDVQAR
ncbi:PQQ-binding-like beta-propeller repeat protein [Thermus caldilimi]|uniref:PQQ-binding-like beta-propeller repeat protein n=1 Tax=Thermus caldilimi TaxID=2483360 RepID=UPI0010763A76|nr:PQQ-binding-like beta-propeller repeat protein [Thermus caldilimi]